ncbi:MAG: zinc-ribbon domain-containing protein, partial [Chloroflexi bacterium]
MDCPNCKSRNTEDARFCSNCGYSLQQYCGICGTELQVGARFCHHCGHPVEAKGLVETGFPSQTTTFQGARTFAGSKQISSNELQRYLPKELLHKLESARANRIMAGERRIVTILFCDVKGSTEAAADLDPEEWAEIINGAFEHMIRPVYRYEGTVARLQGDGLLAFFGAPIAHEDDPQRAVLTGLEIIELFEDYAVDVKERWGIDFAVRVGVNTGMVVVGAVGSDLRVEYSALGDAINLAARMEQTALPGTVQIAEPTHKLVAPLFDFEELNDLIVKGREKPVRAFRVLRQKAAPGSLRGIAGLEAPLTGRQAQLDALLSAFQDLLIGKSHILSVVGEAGLGKTRLISEFKHNLMKDWPGAIEWLEGPSVSYDSSTPFAPFNQMLSSLFHLDPGLPHQDNLDRIIQHVESIQPGQSSEIIPFLAAMLGIPLPAHLDERVKYMEPQQLRSLIFKHVERLIETFASSNPIILFLDDLHWADPTS